MIHRFPELAAKLDNASTPTSKRDPLLPQAKNQYVDNAEQWISQHPGWAVASAVALGVLLALVVKRR